jgi:hypothetical protein
VFFTSDKDPGPANILGFLPLWIIIIVEGSSNFQLEASDTHRILFMFMESLNSVRRFP